MTKSQLKTHGKLNQECFDVEDYDQLCDAVYNKTGHIAYTFNDSLYVNDLQFIIGTNKDEYVLSHYQVIEVKRS